MFWPHCANAAPHRCSRSGDVCTAAARVHIDRSRSHAVSARFAACALEINSGVARAAFSSTRFATTRRGKSALPPNLLVLPLSKGCTVCTVVRSRSCRAFEYLHNFAVKEQNFKYFNFSTRSVTVTLSQPIKTPNNFHFIEEVPFCTVKCAFLKEPASIYIFCVLLFHTNMKE